MKEKKMEQKVDGTVDEGSAEKVFIRKALRYIANKQGMKMPFLERRLLLAGMMKDPRVSRDFREFADTYFEEIKKDGKFPEIAVLEKMTKDIGMISVYKFFKSIAKDVKF